MATTHLHNANGPEMSGSHPELTPEYIDIAFLREPDAPQTDPILEAALKVGQEATRLREQAIKEGESYSLMGASNEDMATMFRAIAFEGQQVAETNRIDPQKLEIARWQLDAALGEKLNPESTGTAAVDAATYMIAALSLARRRDTTDDPAERIVTVDALDSLREAADAERVRREQALGPRAGELVVAAITAHH